jgi:uncharacterized membrane protein
MASLTVWRFDSPDGAARAAALLEELVRTDTLVLHDAAIVEWESKRRKPRTRQLSSPALTAALGGGFWGLLFGLVFFVPLLGAAVGSAGGSVAGALDDVGIDDHFINRIRDQVTPGTSALFVLSSHEAADQVHAAFADGPRAELTITDLDKAQEAALREVFGD